MTMPEVDRVHRRAMRTRSSRPGADRHDGDVGARAPTTATASTTDHGRHGGAGRSCSRAARATSPQRAGVRRGGAARRSRRSRRSSTATRTSSTTGGVLVVGASATGVQIADEIQRSGRPVTLAVGEHVRVPRALPGPRHPCGGWTRRACSTSATTRSTTSCAARSVPSLAARRVRPTARTLDLNALTAHRRRAGRPARRRSATAGAVLRLACATSARWPTSSWAGCSTASTSGRRASGVDGDVEPPHRFEPTRGRRRRRRSTLDLARGEIRTIIWATGFRPDYSWLDVPVLDRKGRIRHDGGVVDGARACT